MGRRDDSPGGIMEQTTASSSTVSFPEDLGLDSERLGKAQAFLESAIVRGDIPGAVALVAREGRVVAHWSLGSAQIEDGPRAMQTDTIFDLASLTKAVAGATMALL